MRVGIVTVTFNSLAVLPDFLRSVEGQTHADFRLYVVDNASADGTCAYIRANSPNAIMLCNSQNVGFAAGTNQGIRRAISDGCDSVLLINNDVSFGPDLLQLLVEGQSRHGTEMTTPLMYYHEPKNRIWAAGGELQTWAGCRAIHHGQGREDVGQYHEPRQVSFTPFCCILIQRSVFERIGLLDETFFAYVEDTDFLYRCRQEGISLWFIPQARLWHKVSSLTGDASPFSLHYGARNRSYFIKKHIPFVRRSFFDLLFLTYYLGRYVLRVDSRATCQLRLRGWAEGRRVLTSPPISQPGE